jgi:hypothetical protein
MAMQVESLEVLENAEVAPAQIAVLASGEDVRSLQREITERLADLRAEIHEKASGVSRQMYVAILGQMAVLLGFAYFFSTHLR